MPNPKVCNLPISLLPKYNFQKRCTCCICNVLIFDLLQLSIQFFASIFSAFSRLKRLKKLNLDSNNITEVKAFAFKGLSDLIEISLQNNPIKVSKPQCGNFMIFLSLRFYVRSSKIAVFRILGALKMIHLVDFSRQRVQKFIKITI